MYALCSWCGVFAPGAKPCTLCKMVSRPESQYCDNRGRGCPGTASDFGPALTENAIPGSPAFVMGQQLAEIVRTAGKEKADRLSAWRAGGGDRGGAAPRSVGWGPTEYEPDGAAAWAPRGGGRGGGRGGTRRRARPDELTGRPGASPVGGVAGPRTCSSARDAHASTLERGGPGSRHAAWWPRGRRAGERPWLRQANLRAGLRRRPRATRRPQAAASWSS